MVSGPTSRAVGRLKKKKMMKSQFCRYPYLTLTGHSSDARIKDHSRNTVSYPKSLRIQAFESLEDFKMYYAIGAVHPCHPYIESLPTL